MPYGSQPTPAGPGHGAGEQTHLDLLPACHLQPGGQFHEQHCRPDLHGLGIGDLAIAAPNVAFPVFTLITALACLIGIGRASGYSLFLGRRDEAGARKNLGNAVVLAVAVGLLMAVLGLVFLEPMLYLFRATEAMMPTPGPIPSSSSWGCPSASLPRPWPM